MGPRVLETDEHGVARVEFEIALSVEGRVVVPVFRWSGDHPEIPELVEEDIEEYLKSMLDLDGCRKKRIAVEFCP